MRFKYKKTILVIAISTMGIGAITLSIGPNHKANHTANPVTPTISAESLTQAPSDTLSTQNLTVTPSPAATATPFPVYDLEENAYPKITDLFHTYFKAKLDCNVDALKKIFTNSDGLPSKSELKKEVEFINDYKNIKCYVKKGYLEGTYIVFTYYEIKYMNIKTPVPAMSQYYLVTGEDKNLRIYSDTFDKATWDYYVARTQDDDVMALSAQTDKKLQSALKKDKTLKVFWDNLMKVQSSSNN